MNRMMRRLRYRLNRPIIHRLHQDRVHLDLLINSQQGWDGGVALLLARRGELMSVIMMLEEDADA